MRQLSVVFVCVASAACNCGGPTNARDLYIAQYAELCDWAARCGYIGRSQETKCVMDSQTYYDQTVRVSQTYDVDAAIRAGRLSINSGAANQCLGLIRASTCSTSSFLFGFSSTCQQVYQGRVAPGGQCSASVECAGGTCAFTTPGGNSCNGICVAWAAEGQSCATAGCDPSRHFCDASRVCRARGNIGAACRPSSFGSGECIDGLGCTSAGICARPGSGGEACASGLCAKGFHCVGTGTSSVCAADVRHGDTCPDPLACPDGDRCVGTAPGTSGICTRVLDVNDVCDPARDACPSTAPCSMTSRTCTPPVVPMEGSSCATSSCFASGSSFLTPGPQLYCERATNTCRRKLMPGETCVRQNGEDPCTTSCSATMTGASGTCNMPTVSSCF